MKSLAVCFFYIFDVKFLIKVVILTVKLPYFGRVTTLNALE